MARKLRLEFPGACYHVINRGNYRRDVFATGGAKAAFEQCLFAACLKSGWRLHAFVIMRNHYHLALETPEGNLVDGMHWLQGTFANRFNRLRREHGHLFQGRYKAIPVERGKHLGAVGHYIHLNPVRAGIVPADRLGEYRRSSFWYLHRPGSRPPCLGFDAVLADAGNLADSPVGWDGYAAFLGGLAAEGPTDSATAPRRGWAMGSEEFKAALIKDHAIAALARAWQHQGACEIRARQWEDLCRRAMRLLDRSEEALAKAGKSARWKVAIAAILRERSGASHAWLAVRLQLGGAKYVSRLVIAAQHSGQTFPELALLRAKWAT